MSLDPLPSPAFNGESLRDRVDSATAGVLALQEAVATLDPEDYGPRLGVIEAGLADLDATAFASLDALQAASPPNRGVTLAGQPLVPDTYTPGASTLVAANLRRFAPADGVLRLSMVADDASLVSDAKSHILTMLADAEARGWEARITAAKDPAIPAWETDFIEHTLTAQSLRLSFDPRALLYTKPCSQAFLGNGVQTVFPITAWDYTGPVTERLEGMLVSPTGVASTYYASSNFSTEAASGGGWQVRTNSPVPNGHTLVVSSARAALTIRGTAGAGQTVYGHGGRFDLTRAGYLFANSGRSGLSLNSVDHIRWTGMIHAFGSPATAYDQPELNKRGDSAVGTLGHQTASFEHIRGDYLNDLVFYNTGNGNPGTSDDGLWTHVGLIEGFRTNTGFKSAREHSALTVDAVHLTECATGFVHGVTSDGLKSSGSVQVGKMRLERVGRRAVDIRENVAPLSFGSVIVRDIGRYPDGSVYQPDPAVAVDSCAVFLSQARGVQIGFLGLTFRDWTPVADRPAVQVSSTDNYGNRIESGFIEGCAVGVRETGSTDNEKGNFWRLTMKDVAAPTDFPGSAAEFDFTLLTETGGAITQSFKRRRGIRSSFDPEMYFSGSSAPSHTKRSGTWIKDDYNRCTVSVEVQAAMTHSGGGSELRISLPATSDSYESEPQVFPLAHYSGISVPGDDTQLVAEIPAGESHARLRYWYDDGTPDGATGTITTAHVTSGATVRLILSGTYFATL